MMADDVYRYFDIILSAEKVGPSVKGANIVGCQNDDRNCPPSLLANIDGSCVAGFNFCNSTSSVHMLSTV